MDQPYEMPDLYVMKIKPETIVAQCEPGSVQFMVPPPPDPVADNMNFPTATGVPWFKGTSDDPVRGHPNWRRAIALQWYPQDDPRWKLARSIPGMISASSLYRYLLMAHGTSGNKLGLSSGMIVRPNNCQLSRGGDPAWYEWEMKMRYARFPGLPSDPISHTFMGWGSINEDNALNAAMRRWGHKYIYRDRGLVVVTPKRLQDADLKYAIHRKGQEVQDIHDLPFLLAASPDGLLEDKETGVVINCEWKAATAFLPNNRGYKGLEFQFRDAKPYDKPKSYYIPQMMLQMLACDTQECKFGCWTYGNGMNVWTIKYNKRYVEIMITLLLYIHSWRTAQGESNPRNVPIGFFYDKNLGCPQEYRDLYKELEDLTLQIVNTPMEEFIPGEYTRQVANEALGITDGRPPVPRTDIYFPNAPPQLPLYQIMNVYARYFCGTSAFPLAPEPTHMDVRRAQVFGLADALGLRFATPVLKMIIEVGLDDHRPVFAEPAVAMFRLDRAEKYLLPVVALIYRAHVEMREKRITDEKRRDALRDAHVSAALATYERVLNARLNESNVVFSPANYGIMAPCEIEEDYSSSDSSSSNGPRVGCKRESPPSIGLDEDAFDDNERVVFCSQGESGIVADFDKRRRRRYCAIMQACYILYNHVYRQESRAGFRRDVKYLEDYEIGLHYPPEQFKFAVALINDKRAQRLEIELALISAVHHMIVFASGYKGEAFIRERAPELYVPVKVSKTINRSDPIEIDDDDD